MSNSPYIRVCLVVSNNKSLYEDNSILSDKIDKLAESSLVYTLDNVDALRKYGHLLLSDLLDKTMSIWEEHCQSGAQTMS
jgi:hypothetical protein